MLVSQLDPAVSDDAELIGLLRDLVNRAYEAGERGLWQPGGERISASGIVDLIAAGQLAVARDGERIVGCVRLAELDDDTAELGLLAVAEDALGSGVGHSLVAFAQERSRERGYRTMQLQLLVPRAGSHPFKLRLDAWYRRLGYRVVRREDFAARYAEVAQGLAGPCDLVIYERPLRAPAA